MKRLCVFLLFALLSAGAAHPELAQVHSVYLLPMTGNLDQLLAVRLTESSIFQVVTDPRKADAIFTARIGASFEEALKDLYASTAPKDASKDKLQEETYAHPAMKPLSRAKGSL